MPVDLVLGSFSPSVLLRVARRLGLLDDAGLRVQERAVPSSPAQFRALLDGDLDAAITSPDNVLAYRFCPDNPLGAVADVSIVAAVDRGLGLALYARNGTTFEELRGAVWGVDVPTSGFALAMYAIGESMGLSRDDYRLASLGSTPRRVDALLAGDCAATILGAGNDLRAEGAGMSALARVSDVCSPYLGTVLAVAGGSGARNDVVNRLAQALRTTAQVICSGGADSMVIEEAAGSLSLPSDLAERYLARLTDRREGLVPDGVVDAASLTTLIALRRRFLPCLVDGVDALSGALDAGSGLLLVEATTAPEAPDR